MDQGCFAICDPTCCVYPANKVGYTQRRCTPLVSGSCVKPTDSIVYKTLSGTEVAFEISLKDTIVSYQVGMSCEIDTSQSQTVIGTSQIIEISFLNSTIPSKPITVNLIGWPQIVNRDAYETVVVSHEEIFSKVEYV